jgi:hypothetical protein
MTAAISSAGTFLARRTASFIVSNMTGLGRYFLRGAFVLPIRHSMGVFCETV